ncbi:MAG: hypothetical protein HOW73_20965 [Polyangiaceae bacterium]|nr:hypothetical protein [Polyangiaceae bacterium]
MLLRKATAILALSAAGMTAACTNDTPGPGSNETAPTATTTSANDAAPAAEVRDEAFDACTARWNAVQAAPGRSYGAGVLETERELYLGRARGAVTLFVREPAASTATAKLEKEIPGTRVMRIAGRTKHDKPALRDTLLREGYVYATNPDDSFELDARIKLIDLFDEEHIVLERGEETFALERKKNRYETVYVYEDGPRKGKTAQVLFGDRLRKVDDPKLDPLHRDVLSFSHREGFDRMDIERVSNDAILAKLHYGETVAKVVVGAQGAKLSVECFAEPHDVRDAVTKELEKKQWRMRAEARMREVINEQLDEALPFDRPRDEKGPDRDGELRPYWLSAYKNRRPTFEADGQGYPVFLPDGRPQPPQVCVDFVLDTYERAAGSWYTRRDEAPNRPAGRLDISTWGIENRRGVLGFMKFAQSSPDYFDFRPFRDKERIPFANRREFFTFLRDHHAEFQAGDVLAIQGLKRDDRVHQHAILLEYTDPLTGFPAGLADQMKVPRRRTWEGIMAEAPKRSLLYRARPTDSVFKPLDDGAERSKPAALTLASSSPATR